MGKLTKAQRDILSGGHFIAVSAYTGQAWTGDRQGFTKTVRRSTFEALRKQGFIAITSSSIATDTYRIAPVGRAALEDGR